MLRRLLIPFLLVSISVAASNQQSVTTFTLSVAKAGVVKLSWNASTTAGVTSYNIYRSTISGGFYGLIGSTTATTYTDNPGVGTFYYVATAVDPSGQSVKSNQATAVVP
jgi:fibronectin type 3 domain-containing protein